MTNEHTQRIEELTLCLEICRGSLEHHEEISEQKGKKEMHAHLYACGAMATRVLAKTEGHGMSDYWQRVREFGAQNLPQGERA